AVSLTIEAVGLDDTCQMGYHLTNINLQLSKSKNSLPPISRPRRSVSGERIAPNQCTRIAKQRLIEIGWACGVTLASKVTFTQ
ncbi:MAG TPA: hypothetical protein VGD99_22380, partial [Anaerolineae bacterium]